MLINKQFNEEKIQSPLHYMWSTFKTHNIAFTAMFAVIMLMLSVLLANIIIPYLSSNPATQPHLLPPYWLDGGSSLHILGTDQLGRDSLSRILKGIQITLGGGLLITLFVTVFGLIIGASAALTTGLRASVLHHLLDTFLTMPTLLIAIIFMVILGPSYESCLLAILLSLLPKFIRGIHLSIENELHKQYIIALRLDGATNLRLLRYGIIPNIMEPVFILINRIFTLAVLEISTLGFLGFGSPDYDAELGQLIAKGLVYTFTSPWLIIFPGFAIFFIILIFNIFAEGLRHAVNEAEDE